LLSFLRELYYDMMEEQEESSEAAANAAAGIDDAATARVQTSEGRGAEQAAGLG
jgi:hypothetical protein